MTELKKYPTKPFESWARMKELRKGHFWHTWRAHDEGELVVMGQPTLDAILSGFGNVATPGYDPNFNRVLRDVDKVLELQEAVDAQGYGNELCSAMRLQLGGMFQGTNIRSPEGKIVKPDFIFQWHLCHPLAKCAQIAGEYMGVPFFLVDSPPRNAPGWKEWFVDQMQEFIEWAEKLTGRTYDDEKLVEATKNEWEMMVTFARMNELTQAIPTPLDARHMQSLRMPTVTYRFKKEGVEYAHMLYDEVKQRVADGISARGYEEKRIIGNVRGGMFERGRGREDLMEKYDVVSVAGPVGAFSAWTVLEDGTWIVPETPQERGIEIRTREDALAAEAELWLGGGRVDRAHMIVQEVQPTASIKEVEQWHIDAVIMRLDRSTEAACGAGTIEVKKALQEAGIPVLCLEGSMADPRFVDSAKNQEESMAFFESIGIA
ncbi:2-hydroxyacyl-CoA dehydratase [Thermodesulfobacteriota bacterium]